MSLCFSRDIYNDGQFAHSSTENPALYRIEPDTYIGIRDLSASA